MPKKQSKRIKRRGRKPRNVDWSGPETKHGPFGLFSNVRLFYLIGIVIMVGSLALGGALCQQQSTPTPTPTPAAEGTGTPTPSADQITPTATVEQVKQWPAPPAMTIDVTKTYTAKLTTSKGSIDVDLFAAEAPSTVNNFAFLAQEGFFANMPFFYVDPASYVATGDPSLAATVTSKGGPGYEMAMEPSTGEFDVGTLGMFAGEEDGMTAGSRFFIVLDPTQFSFDNLTAFGQVKSGMDVVESLTPSDTLVSVEIQVQ